MSSTYESVTNGYSSPGIAGGTLKVGNCSNIAYGAFPQRPLPSSVTRSYEPYKETRTLYDPSKGRSFKSAKNTGAILFSDYTNSLVITREYVSSRERDQRQFYQLFADCVSSPPTCYVGPLINLDLRWTQNDDIRSLSARIPIIGRPRSSYDGEIRDAISVTQQAAFDQALNAYDLLSELGELKETSEYLMSKLRGGADLLAKFADKDPLTYQRGRRKTPRALMRSGDAAFRSLGKRWMEYRYALMPLFYSFTDISKLFKEKAYRYQSDRSKQEIDLNNSPEPTGDESLHVWSSGKVLVRSLTKARFDAGDLQRLITLLGMNPLRTAWELTPLSFVADWFFNIGEAITALTGIDYASERSGVTSLRETSTFTYVHRDRSLWNYTQRGNAQNLCGTKPPKAVATFDRKFENVVMETKVDSYIRTVWSRPTPRIVFDPFLNWKRFIDSVVLGYQPTKKILRSLR